MKHKRYSNKKIKEMIHDAVPQMEKAREEGRSLYDQDRDSAQEDHPAFETDEAKK
ncbi:MULTISPECIES: hypothetical protein [Salinivibrio]|jgi:hypothetical protein|uniref:Uncharacterized protein n=2 Tax=Salinivibrio TaxID=51366 RepID=A0ABY7L9W6_9GAMM|nr:MULTISPECIES: hypothetical protein [Salinivibrio]QIR06574.1 hypothetical protein HBA18_09475 [Salinivibrio costicola]WBA14044.1 hypothetical protein N7E60_09970 [Salinivibrio proteolyticus]